ncbi:hypothetical protein JCM8097_001469 [Rhodosporidiobolus ruineniae]
MSSPFPPFPSQPEDSVEQVHSSAADDLRPTFTRSDSFSSSILTASDGSFWASSRNSIGGLSCLTSATSHEGTDNEGECLAEGSGVAGETTTDEQDLAAVLASLDQSLNSPRSPLFAGPSATSLLPPPGAVRRNINRSLRISGLPGSPSTPVFPLRHHHSAPLLDADTEMAPPLPLERASSSTSALPDTQSRGFPFDPSPVPSSPDDFDLTPVEGSCALDPSAEVPRSHVDTVLERREEEGEGSERRVGLAAVPAAMVDHPSPSPSTSSTFLPPNISAATADEAPSSPIDNQPPLPITSGPSPSDFPVHPDDAAAPTPYRQKTRFRRDLFTPTWVRGKGEEKEGWCELCAVAEEQGGARDGKSKWYKLRSAAYWFHRSFFHGINSADGRPYPLPLAVRPVPATDGGIGGLEGLCGRCHEWTYFESASASSPWLPVFPLPTPSFARPNRAKWYTHVHGCTGAPAARPQSPTESSGGEGSIVRRGSEGSVEEEAPVVAVHSS